MTVRTGEIAADVAWARPPVIPAALILGYSGPAFAGLGQIQSWGKPFLLGYESITTRAYSGTDGGIADAQQLISVARTIPGYVEGNCGLWFCAADENSTPAWALSFITEYAAAFTATVRAVGWYPQVELPYGNPEAFNAALAGIAQAGGTGGAWGVGTWRCGEGGGPNQPPADSDAWLLQSGNTPGPADGTDLDWLYVPLDKFGAWGGPAPTPLIALEDNMNIIISPSHCFSIQGSVKLRDFVGDRSFLGLPADAIDYSHSTTPNIAFAPVTDFEADVLLAGSENILHPPVAPAGPCPDCPPVTGVPDSVKTAAVSLQAAAKNLVDALA